MQTITIGHSHLNAPIKATVIGNGKRHVLYNASHHANEWITTNILQKFIEACAADLTWQQHTTLHAIPIVNPDGVALVTGKIPNESLHYHTAKALSPHTHFPNGWKANIKGVDLNSNYPAHWEDAKAYKFNQGYTHPGPRDYVGPYPLSEPETQAMTAYTKAHDFQLTISLHTQGEEIYWKYKNYNPPGAAALAERFAEASGYALQNVPSESANAGYRDWFIQTFNRPGFTIECGLGENPLPFTQFESIYKKVAPLLWEGLRG